jgi:5-dehydro-2-deoxygluconokinase
MIDSDLPYDLLAIGRSSIDLYSTDIGTPFHLIRNFAAYVGGCPTNISVGARRLGLRTALLTAVGDDLVGDFILHFLKQEDVEIAFIPRKTGRRSSAVLMAIQPPDKFPLIFYRDNCADIELNLDDVSATPLTLSKVVLITGTGLSKEPSRSATMQAAIRAKTAGATIVLDLDFRPDQWIDVRSYGIVISSVLQFVDIVIGNEDEVKATQLQDISKLSIKHSQATESNVTGDLQKAVHHLLETGPKTIVIKQGSLGSTVFTTNGEVIPTAGFNVEVCNVLGAGDAFASGLIYGYLKGWDWYHAARMGNACGAILVTRHGCANFMPYEKEVLQFIEEQGGF